MCRVIGVKCVLTLPVMSDTPGTRGNWSYQREVTMPSVPRAGDYVTLAAGWGAHPVNYTSYDPGTGTAHVLLKYSSLHTADDVSGLGDALEMTGWEKLGGPWLDDAQHEDGESP